MQISHSLDHRSFTVLTNYNNVDGLVFLLFNYGDILEESGSCLASSEADYLAYTRLKRKCLCHRGRGRLLNYDMKQKLQSNFHPERALCVSLYLLLHVYGSPELDALFFSRSRHR